MKNRLPVSILIIFLCALTVIAPVLFTRTTWFMRDLTYIFHPWKSLCAEMVQRGEVPLWNPYAYGGMPLLANWQTAVFYPLSLLFYLFPFAWALKFFHLFHIFLAGVFALLAGRRMGMTRAGALAGGLVFALNGYIITRLEFLSHIGADIWLFALILFLRHPVLLAIAGACAFFAGHQVLGLMAVIVIGYSLAQPDQSRCFRALAAATAVSLVIVACQLIPTADLALHSARVAEGIDSATAMLYSVLPVDLRRLITPLFDTATKTAVIGEKLPWTATFHVGIVAAILVILAVFRRRSRSIVVFSVMLVIVGTILSVGDASPVYPWLYRHCPGFSLIRYPVQFMLFTVTGAAILAGEALRGRWAFVVIPVLAAELLCYAWDFQPRAPDGFFTAPDHAAAILQAQPDSRSFLLSPGTEKERHFRGPSVASVWQTARNYLYGLVCLPYHVPNAYGTGEPLVPAHVARAIDLAYRQQTPAAVLPYLKTLNIGYLVCRKPLQPTKGFTPIMTSGPYIYRVEESATTYKPRSEDFRHQKEYNDNPDFYRPLSFLVGVPITVLGLLCLAGYGIIKLKAMH